MITTWAEAVERMREAFPPQPDVERPPVHIDYLADVICQGETLVSASVRRRTADGWVDDPA